MPGCFVHTLPFFASCNDMLAMLVRATRWLSMHLYVLPYMFMHKSCLLVCHPYFNTVKIWTPDPNLHLSPMDTTFCWPFCLLTFLLVCFLVRLLSCLFAYLSLSCLPPHAMLAISIFLVCFVSFAHYLHISFFPLLVCWFLVLAFACTHMEQGRMELGHDLPSANKKGEDASMSI